jgi:hypothetical protein
LSNVLETNEEVYRFEKMLEQQHDVAGHPPAQGAGESASKCESVSTI